MHNGLSLVVCSRYCWPAVSGRRMQCFLQLRLRGHGLHIAAGRLAGVGHVDSARVYLACGAVGNESI